MRRQVVLGPDFAEAAFDEAFTAFRRMYHVRPERVLCPPDVLQRLAQIYGNGSDDALWRDLRFEGIPLLAAVVKPGTVVFEGHVDEERMGDW